MLSYWNNLYSSIVVGTVSVFTLLWIMNRKKKQIVYLKPKTASFKTKEQLDNANWIRAGKVTDLWIYPIKSCKAIDVDSAGTKQQGLTNDVIIDRIFMVVGEKGNMFTGRAFPQMVLITPKWEGDSFTLNYPDVDSVTFSIKEVLKANVQKQVSVWSDQAPGLDCGEDAAKWLTTVLKKPCRLVYHGDIPSPRKCHLEEYPILKENDNAYYADLTSCMLMTKETIDELSTRVTCSISPQNFRPNILIEGSAPYSEDDWEYVRIGEAVFRNVKPCTRCIFTTIDYKTGTKDKNMEPLRTLRTYRCVEGDKDPHFGINLGLDVPGIIHVGDEVFVTTIDDTK